MIGDKLFEKLGNASIMWRTNYTGSVLSLKKEQLTEIFDDFYFSMLGYGLTRHDAWYAAKKYCSDHFFTKEYCKILGWWK